MASKKPTLESVLAGLVTPRLTKLKQVAAQMSYRSGYAPVSGKEHCPKCWTSERATYRLRTEPHHNALGVFAFVCDSCGFYLAF